ncbi:MAG: serine protease [Nitrospirae bacterium]|nr:MAG: serine protease [Nitrospirota bacterium]
MKLTAWIDPWRDATVAIGHVHSFPVTGRGGQPSRRNFFVVIGTGVMFWLKNDPTRTPWLVTAKHVFLDQAEGWAPSHLQIRFSWLDAQPVDEHLGVRITLKQRGRRRWLAHPDPAVDLACLPLAIPPEQAGRTRVPTVTMDDFAAAKDIYEGAPVVVLGYPGAVGPHFWTRAIVRQGIISWVSPTQPQSTPFLIDSNVFPGNSGGPVFKLPAGTDRHGHFAAGGKVALLGIVTQARIQKLPLTVGGKELEVQLKGKKRPETPFVPSFIGLGVIEPAFRVKQLLSAATLSRKH